MATEQPTSPLFTGLRPLGQAQATSLPQRQASHIVLSSDEPSKDGTTAEEPPPAYTPPVPTQLRETLTAQLLTINPTLAARLRALPITAPTAAMRGPSPDPDEEPFEELSPISLRISTRVNVARDNNIVALSCSPAEQANSIAAAIMAAFKSVTVVEGGIPMIDQEGRPRPVRIEVDAGVTVEGANNVVGTEAAVMDVMRARHAVLRQRMASVSVSVSGATAAGPSDERRRRSVATESEEPAAKRRRVG